MTTFTDKQIAEWKAIAAHITYEMETLATDYGKDVMLKGVREALREYEANEVDRKVHRLDI